MKFKNSKKLNKNNVKVEIVPNFSLSKRKVKKDKSVFPESTKYLKALLKTDWAYNLCDKFKDLDENAKKERFTHYKKNLTNAFVKSAKVVIVLALATTLIYSAINFGPGIMKEVSNFITSRTQPPAKVEKDFNPQFDIIDNKINTNISANFGSGSQQDQIFKINIDEVSSKSYSNLIANLSDTAQIYLNDDSTITPLFVYPTEKDDVKFVTIFCQLDSNKIAKFEYELFEPESEQYYDNIFESNNISPANIINSLTKLLSSDYLTDVPHICNSIGLNKTIYSCVDNLKKDSSFSLDQNGNYVEENFYSFTISSLEKNGQITESKYKIKQETAENLKGFNSSNLNSLIEIFRKDNSNFDLVEETSIEANAPTCVLVNLTNHELNQMNTLLMNNQNGNEMSD